MYYSFKEVAGVLDSKVAKERGLTGLIQKVRSLTLPLVSRFRHAQSPADAVTIFDVCVFFSEARATVFFDPETRRANVAFDVVVPGEGQSSLIEAMSTAIWALHYKKEMED